MVSKNLAKSFLSLLIFWLTFAFVVISDKAYADNLTVVTLTDWAPYSDEALPNKGFSNDLLVEVMKRAGHTITIQMRPWTRALAEATEGQYDILASAWHSEERAQNFIFSEPFAVNRLVFVKRADSPFEFHKIQDLKGKRIGTSSAYAYPEAFMNSKIFIKEPVSNVVQNLHKLVLGRIDLTLDDELTLRYLIHTKSPELANKIAFNSKALSENKLYMAFPKKRSNSAKLVKDFNEGLAKIQADGTYEYLLKKHKMK